MYVATYKRTRGRGRRRARIDAASQDEARFRAAKQILNGITLAQMEAELEAVDGA